MCGLSPVSVAHAIPAARRAGEPASSLRASLRSRSATGIVVGRSEAEILPFMSASFHAAILSGPGSQDRVLMICVIASILAHAAVLLLFPGMRQGPPAAVAVAVLTATISRRAEAPPSTLAEVPRPREPERSRTPLKPEPEPPRPLLTRPDTAPSAPRVSEPPPLQTAPAPPSVPQAPANTARVPEVPSAPVPAAPAPGQTDAADRGTLDQYRLALLGAANRYKRYPAIAMEKGWAGRVEIRIVIGANGLMQSIAVKTSSGFDLLDRTAVDMVTKAKPMTTIPPALRGREFAVDIPVIFSLQTG